MTATLSRPAAAAPVPRPADPRKRRLERMRLTAIVLVSLVFALPLVWMVLAAFKTNVQIGNTADSVVFTPTLDNFRTVFDQGVFLPAMVNSIIVAVVSTVLSALIAVPAAWAIGRFGMRRAGGWASPELKCGPILLDTRAQTVKVGDAPVELTTFEYRILEYLIHRAGEVISKSELTERLYAQDFDRDSNTIEVFIGRLRRKLDPDDTIKPIETLRGRGYRFALQRESAA